jgi:hypothetical protein
MAVVAMHEGKSVARPLSVLVPLIQKDLEQAGDAAKRASMPYYKAAGEKMLEAKGQLSHGEFGPWIKRNFNISQGHASRYMSFAHATRDTQNSRYENFSDFMRKDGGDPGYGKVVRKQDWHEGVKGNIERARTEAKRIQNENLSRQQERDADRKLALKLIDIGFKVLAKELHPDKGGTRDAMSRLSRVRDRLKSHA